MPGETGVDETSSGVGEQAEATEGAFAFQARGDVSAEGDDFVERAEDEFARVQDECAVCFDFDEACEFVLFNGGVDDGVLVVVEETEEAVEVYVD